MTDLHVLLELQQHDTTADQLRHRRSHLPEQQALDTVGAEIRTLSAQAATAQRRLDEITAEQSSLEAEVATIDARRSQLDRKLAATSVPREAAAFTTELTGLRERKSGLEDREIELMEEAEPLEATLASLTDRITAREADAEAADAALTVARAEVDVQLEQVIAARAEAEAKVPPALVKQYEVSRPRFGGVAVATLVGGRCTGCNLTLSASELDRIRHESPDVPVECEQCGRLLVR